MPQVPAPSLQLRQQWMSTAARQASPGTLQKTVTSYKGTVVWESAAPVRAALKTKLPDGFDGQYVLGVTGVPLTKSDSKGALRKDPPIDHAARKGKQQPLESAGRAGRYHQRHRLPVRLLARSAGAFQGRKGSRLQHPHGQTGGVHLPEVQSERPCSITANWRSKPCAELLLAILFRCAAVRRRFVPLHFLPPQRRNRSLLRAHSERRGATWTPLNGNQPWVKPGEPG